MHLTSCASTPAWELDFEFDFDEDDPPTIRPVTEDGQILTPAGAGSLAAFLTAHGLLITFEDEVVLVERGFLLRPDRGRRLFPIDAIETSDWSGLTSSVIHNELSTIQHRAIQALSAEDEWEIVIEDDGTGELADIVLKRTEDTVEVLMAQCKYSSGDEPGARINDFMTSAGSR